MLKKLLSFGYLDVYKMLVDNYLKLGLDENEMVSLLQLFNLSAKGKNLNFSSLKGKTNLDFNKSNELINNLIDKGFIEVLSVTKNGKETFNLSLEPTMDKFDELFHELEEETRKIQKEQFMKEIIDFIQIEFGRDLSANEISTVSNWESQFGIEQVKNAVFLASKNEKLSISYIDRILINGNN